MVSYQNQFLMNPLFVLINVYFTDGICRQRVPMTLKFTRRCCLPFSIYYRFILGCLATFLFRFDFLVV